MKVPQIDLGRARDRIEEELNTRWAAILDSTAFVGGQEVAEFERTFSDYVQADTCVGVANGTDALVVALRALELQPGDEVIVPSFTFIATGAAVVLAGGGTPVFCDVDPRTLNIDLDSAAERVTDRTVGVIGVHLYGRPFEVDAAASLCDHHGLWLIEDCAQAHGARQNGRPVGGIGHVATWSFYPAKNLGCFGDGGAVTGPEGPLLGRLRQIANHGRAAHYEHDEVGTNSRLDGLQAAVLNCRLALLETDNAARRRLADQYRERLTGVGDLQLLEDRPDDEPVHHQLAVLSRQRDELRASLSERGIGTAIHYPIPLHLQRAFAGQSDGALPVSERASREVLCLPMFAELMPHEVDTVCEAIIDYFGSA